MDFLNDQTCHVPGSHICITQLSLGAESEEIRIFGFHLAMAMEVQRPEAVTLGGGSLER